MASFSLTDGTSSLEIALVQWDGDAYISIVVDSRGFTGRNDLHVEANEFSRFCSHVLEIQRTLKGEARMRAVNSSELLLHIHPFGSLGHFSVVGSTGYRVQMAHTSYWHAVHFGFQIDPSQLDNAVKVPWVSQYGKNGS
jgi:hypothetical protein